MDHQDDYDFINYYEVLGVPEGASTAEIEKTLERYQASMAAQVNKTLTMSSARYAINIIIPGIRQNLLSGVIARKLYDEKLAARKKSDEQLGEQDELPDGQGLDLHIKEPFFFDLDNGYSTEPATFTLRAIAGRLDEEWQQARAWITDTSSPIHPMVGYLIHAALRPRLATRIGNIIQAVTRESLNQMDANEGIECCITIFNPQINRPGVSIESPHFDGRVLDAGRFLPDHPAQSEFVLYHSGVRGCAFGTLESRASWLTFQGGATTQRFALMPEGTDATIGPSAITVPLYFQVKNLQRRTDHTAHLIFRLENWEPPIEKVLPVTIHVPALPPRVWFEPIATEAKPLQAKVARRGEPVSVVVTPRNGGDDSNIPLFARIYSDDQAAYATPEKFRANQPITLSIDTSPKPYGKTYDVVYKIDYSQVPGAEGPATLHVHGEILPTPWQSMIRTKAFGNRFMLGISFGFLGFILFGGLGSAPESSLQSGWLLLFVIPLLLLGIMHMAMTTIVAHIRLSGRTEMSTKKISPYVRWILPLAFGLAIALLCGLIHNISTAFLLGGIIGGLVGVALGFIADEYIAGKTPPGNSK